MNVLRAELFFTQGYSEEYPFVEEMNYDCFSRHRK